MAKRPKTRVENPLEKSPQQVQAKRTLDAMDKALEGKKDVVKAYNAGGNWGMPSDPAQRKCIQAITAYYGLDFIMGDVMILAGTKLYIGADGYRKRADAVSVERFGGKPFRWKKRPATETERKDLGYPDEKSRVWYVELYMPEGSVGNEAHALITTAWGEANVANCTLQNASKIKGDPRILNRQAIKRAQHECLRDAVCFRLPVPAEFEKAMGVKLEEVLNSGVQVVTDDGMLPEAEPVPAAVAETKDQPIPTDSSGDVRTEAVEEAAAPPEPEKTETTDLFDEE